MVRSAAHRRVAVVAALAVGLGITLAGCTTAAPTPMASPTQAAVSSTAGAAAAIQTSAAGPVTVTATWKGLAAGPVFTIALDTHSVDLDGYDLTDLALLRTSDGDEVRPAGWDAPKGGHHREGTLTFLPTHSNGKSNLEPRTGSFELIIRDVAGVPERSFTWQS